MPGTKISDLPTAETLGGTEITVVVQSGADCKTTLQDIANLALPNGVTGTGAVVLADAPMLSSPTITSPVLSSPLSVANGGTGLDTYGALDGTSSTKTSAYEVANSDKRSTISLAGNTCYIVTVPAASGFDADFQVRLYNADAGRAKTISVTGYSSFFLWPLQSVVIQNINGAWALFPNEQRWKVSGPVAFYVDPTGNDANDGLTPTSAMATIKQAWDTIRDQTDGPFFIQLTPGATYNTIAGETAVSGELDGDDSASFGRLITITGDTTLVNPPIIQCPSSGTNGIILRDGAWSIISGIHFKATAASGCIGIWVQQKALGDIQNCIWDDFPSGYHIQVEDGGDTNHGLTQKFVTGSVMLAHIFVSAGGKLICGAAFDGGGNAFVFTAGFIQMDLLSRAQTAGSTFANCGSFVGQRYQIGHGSFLDLSGVTLPGSTPGNADATSLAY